MRPAGLDDLWAAARVLHGVTAPARPAAMAALLTRAEAADRYRKRLGRAHPGWGDGTLMAAALATRPSCAPGLSEPDFARALAAALAGLIAWRDWKAARGEDGPDR